MAFKMNIRVAPPKMGGDAIELSAFEGKLIALLCNARDEKKTKFGPRQMTQVAVVTVDSKEPLVGIMFQSYFQDLPLGEVFIGKVALVASGLNKQWILNADNLDKKAVAALVKHLEVVDFSALETPPLLSASSAA